MGRKENMKPFCMAMSALILAGTGIGEAQALPSGGRCDRPGVPRIDIYAADVKINQSDKVGTIYPLSITTSANLGTVVCNGSAGGPSQLLNIFAISDRFVTAIKSLGSYNFDIGIPGLAIRLKAVYAYQSVETPNFSTPFTHYVYQGGGRYFNSGYIPGQFSLVKTAATVDVPKTEKTIKLGTSEIPTTVVSNVFLGGSTTLRAGPVSTFYIHLKFTEVIPTCAFRSDKVNFPLGDVPQETFTTVGSTSPWVTRSLVSAGCTGVAKVHMTFQGTADADDKNLFAVTGGAAGVGVELKSYDDVAAIPDNTTRMSWNPRADGSAYDFKARYRKTKNSITSGEANALITVNLTYD